MKIDISEQFEHLPHAPIVEAVIEIRATAERPWDEPQITERLKKQLPDYPHCGSQSQLQAELAITEAPLLEPKHQDFRWRGLRFQSADRRHVAQFNRDGFLFSRLQPYENWDHLVDEAMRLWRIYADVAQPSEVQRAGLRYVNRIVLPAGEVNFEEYIRPHPVPPRGLELPFVNYLHVDTFEVPGYPYIMNVVRTIQPAQSSQTGHSLIIDIDVFTAQPVQLQPGLLESWLPEMRWLKNKAFFGSITEKASKLFN